MQEVTAIVAYRSGTKDMLDVCLKSLARHTPSQAMRVCVACSEFQEFDAEAVMARHGLEPSFFPVLSDGTSSAIHGLILDYAVHCVDTEFVLTLDSDCFPVAGGWLEDLMGMMRSLAVGGILYPWAPIPSGEKKGAIEERIRLAHCWRNVQVACMMTRMDFIRDNGVSYKAGDDTGFQVCEVAHKLGLQVGGWMPTRCALPDRKVFDPELNRHVAVVYGDKIYHHGGVTRAATMGEAVDRSGLFDSTLAAVVSSGGAEFLLDPSRSHVYRMDDEEAVVRFKMSHMYAAMRAYLESHDSLFGK